MDGQRLGVRLSPPVLGAHTDELLNALGLDADAVQALRQAGAVA